jgi:septum formation protein
MAKHQAYRLILASGSPARRDLLRQAGWEFDVLPAGINEPSGQGFGDPRLFVQHVAWLKAAAVASKLALSPNAATLVLAADTVGWLDGQPIGKPENRDDARRILKNLAGTVHELWTGVCLWRRPDDLQIAWQEMSRVSMRGMTSAELEEYLDTRLWEGCSGAYAIQEGDDPYVRVLEGSKSNVIGLPMETLTRVFTEVMGHTGHDDEV